VRVLKRRYQTAVYWKRTGVDSNGVPVFAVPRELRVRWEDVNEAVLTSAAESVVSSARVFLGEDIQEGDVLRKGTLAETADAARPFNNDLVFEVMVFSKVPTLRATDYLRVAHL